MAYGTVKWFNPAKGYGFLAPDDGTEDIFIHISALEKAGMHQLNDGQKVSYEVEANKGRTSAVNIQLRDTP
ncbi:MAG: cold-shock protein [Alphaproteobacteria bacterium]|nr:cold-shock protein [Alphaproteobacteria bacterium]